MSTVADVLAVLAVVSGAVVYGTDVFALLVLRPALARLDAGTLTATMGAVHRHGDSRLPAPFVIGAVAAVLAAVAAGLGGEPLVAACCALAAVAYGAWISVYFLVSAPINRVLTAAEGAGTARSDAHELQRRWDRVLPARAGLQALALVALGVALAVS